MLTTRDLSRARSDIAEVMFETAYILRPTAGSAYIDAAGHYSESMGTAGTTTARLDPLKLTTQNPFYAAQEAGKALFQLTMPYDTTLYVSDRVVTNGVTVEVLQVHRQHSDKHVIRAVCALVAN